MISFNYLTSKKRSILLILVFIVILLFTGMYVLPKVIDNSGVFPSSENVITNANQPSSVFEKLTEKSFDDAQNILYPIYTSREDYINNFNWETDLAEAKVLKVESEENQLLVFMNFPKNEEVYPSGTQRVTLACNPKSTYALHPTNPHLNVYKSDFDIFDFIEVGDNLHAKCLDKDCFKMGGFCAFVDLNASN